uniref:Uncharacterized protein LOC111110534 isoform X1 n=1 Tax=Crassostrea virginica TaxID=6565 RepID=A0A8B8BHD4_CRAVI|nr:uncharacterized protein LOC111110534 isoform X1 [Crassostrea virginica]
MELSMLLPVYVRKFIIIVYLVRVSTLKTTCGKPPNCCDSFYYSNDSHCVACLAGYFGPNCSLSCRPPNYGLQCQLECKCKKEEQCNHIAGCQSTNRKMKDWRNETDWPVDINAGCSSWRRNEDSQWSLREKSMLITIIILAGISVLIMAIYFKLNSKYERWNYFIHYVGGNINDRNEISIL